MDHVKRAALLCEHCMKQESPMGMQKLKMLCRRIGHDMMRLVRLVPPDEFVMKDVDYQGGQIMLTKTISNFCTRGRSLDEIVGRRRVRGARKVELLILYDDSNSMTSWWRSEYLGRKIPERDSPQTVAKVALLSLLETFGKNANVNVVFFGSKADGLHKSRMLSYSELVRRNGSGGTRLDEALRIAVEERWHRRGGKKFVIILTDGVPEAGDENPGEDAYIQSKALSQIDLLLEFNASVLFAPILTNPKLAYKTYGDYNAYTFSQVLGKRGVTVKTTERLRELPENLFAGVKEMIE